MNSKNRNAPHVIKNDTPTTVPRTVGDIDAGEEEGSGVGDGGVTNRSGGSCPAVSLSRHAANSSISHHCFLLSTNLAIR